MGLFRHLTTVILAILIANPLCCCYALADAGADTEISSCCAHRIPVDQQTPPDLPCPGCQAKNPRVADGGTPPALSPELVELPALAAPRVEFHPHPLRVPLMAGTDVSVPPPPRLVLALQQRFLI